MMTCAERMRRIRVMEKMEKLSTYDNSQVKKADDGSMTYVNKEGNVMVKASMRRKLRIS